MPAEDGRPQSGGLTGLWDTKLSSVRHAQELAGITRTRKKQKVAIRALIAESHEMSENSEMSVNRCRCWAPRAARRRPRVYFFS